MKSRGLANGNPGKSPDKLPEQVGPRGYRIVRPFSTSPVSKWFETRLSMMAQDHKHDILLLSAQRTEFFRFEYRR